MAQGKLKTKVKLPGGAKQKTERNKVYALKKGCKWQNCGKVLFNIWIYVN